MLVLRHNLIGTGVLPGFPQPTSLSKQSISRIIRPISPKNKRKSVICVNLVIELHPDVAMILPEPQESN